MQQNSDNIKHVAVSAIPAPYRALKLQCEDVLSQKQRQYVDQYVLMAWCVRATLGKATHCGCTAGFKTFQNQVLVDHGVDWQTFARKTIPTDGPLRNKLPMFGVPQNLNALVTARQAWAKETIEETLVNCLEWGMPSVPAIVVTEDFPYSQKSEALRIFISDTFIQLNFIADKIERAMLLNAGDLAVALASVYDEFRKSDAQARGTQTAALANFFKKCWTEQT
jgi:hypothetical protein